MTSKLRHRGCVPARQSMIRLAPRVYQQTEPPHEAAAWRRSNQLRLRAEPARGEEAVLVGGAARQSANESGPLLPARSQPFSLTSPSESARSVSRIVVGHREDWHA